MDWIEQEHIAPVKSKQKGQRIPIKTREATGRPPNDSETTASARDEIDPAPKTDWQDKALRLQAEMENFRKRQRRRANEAISAEKARLLARFLPILDNLERALAHKEEGEEPLREGVELIYRELQRVMESEGLTRLETIGQPLDPNWHEALSAIPAGEDVESDTIIEEVEAGYKLDDKLLRPARVVVAT